MKTMLLIVLLAIGLVTLGQYYESKKDPYEVGSHWDYTIECENGFVYKTLGQRRGSIQIFNSDGTPLKCGHKIY
jgi:hypothetical protein